MNRISQDNRSEVGSVPTQNSKLRAENWPQRSCGQCDCVARVLKGRPEERVCANHPDYAGRLVLVTSAAGEITDAGARCRSFRWRREPAENDAVAGEAVRYIPLGDGSFALVDAADYQWLSQYTWRPTGGGYARARVGDKRIFMHRLIMQPPPGKVVDHYNGNRRDNRRGNLRACTQGENNRNKRKVRGVSRYKGVSWYPDRHKWRAQIRHNGRIIRLGWFDDEIEAAWAYDRAAREYFGAFAYLNFPNLGRIVNLTGRGTVCRHARRRFRAFKSEIRNATTPPQADGCCPVSFRKSETNPNSQTPKLKTASGAMLMFRTFARLSSGHCFGFRISVFGIPRCVLSTGPPGAGPRSLTTSYRFATHPMWVDSLS